MYYYYYYYKHVYILSQSHRSKNNCPKYVKSIIHKPFYQDFFKDYHFTVRVLNLKGLTQYFFLAAIMPPQIRPFSIPSTTLKLSSYNHAYNPLPWSPCSAHCHVPRHLYYYVLYTPVTSSCGQPSANDIPANQKQPVITATSCWVCDKECVDFVGGGREEPPSQGDDTMEGDSTSTREPQQISRLVSTATTAGVCLCPVVLF